MPKNRPKNEWIKVLSNDLGNWLEFPDLQANDLRSSIINFSEIDSKEIKGDLVISITPNHLLELSKLSNAIVFSFSAMAGLNCDAHVYEKLIKDFKDFEKKFYSLINKNKLPDALKESISSSRPDNFLSSIKSNLILKVLPPRDPNVHYPKSRTRNYKGVEFDCFF